MDLLGIVAPLVIMRHKSKKQWLSQPQDAYQKYSEGRQAAVFKCRVTSPPENAIFFVKTSHTRFWGFAVDIYMWMNQKHLRVYRYLESLLVLQELEDKGIAAVQWLVS